MRFLFLGDSWTHGTESGKYTEYSKYRFSSLLSRRCNAEEVNLSIEGGSNHSIARIFMEQDLSQFDRVFVQFTYPLRTEFFDKGGNIAKLKIKKVKDTYIENGEEVQPYVQKQLVNPDISPKWERVLFGMIGRIKSISGIMCDDVDWWDAYYEDIYQDEFGKSDEKLFFYLIKNKLKLLNIPHVMTSIDPKCELPIDLQLNQMKYPRANGRISPGGHPSRLGHILICNDILKLL